MKNSSIDSGLDQVFYTLARTEAKIETLTDLYISNNSGSENSELRTNYERLLYKNYESLVEKYRQSGIIIPSNP
jgi:hypothetical protein